MDKRIIKKILYEQKEEINRIFKEKILEREIVKKVKSYLSTNLIKVITGVRRSGKSILAHSLLKKIGSYGYINFDDERFIGVKAKDLNGFLEVLKEIDPNLKYILLDEIQNIEGWELFINRLKRLGYNIIVTGSNSKLLSKDLATHLTGRHVCIEIFPFSFREFLMYKDKKYILNDTFTAEKVGEIRNLFDEYVKYGGFPEVLKIDKEEIKKQYVRDLYEKIITRDIVLRYNVKCVKELSEIALYTLSNYASRITSNKIRNIFEIKSVHTVKKYLSYLEEAYMVMQLNTYSFKIKNQITQPRKVYAIDPSMINSIVPQIFPNYEKILENIVFLELLRKGNKEIYFYLDVNHHEVDFVIKDGLKVEQLIQVCYSIYENETKKREIRSSILISKILGCDNILILTDEYDNEEFLEWHGLKRKVVFMPVWKWLLNTE